MASRNLFYVLALSCLLAASFAQQQNYVDEEEEFVRPQHRSSSGFSRPRPSAESNGPKPTPVPILKQINRHNEDGSYTYGYEGADGSFKIETKLNTGEVMGKYGYVDDNGKVRVVEYGANKFGFMPSGEGITVAPPTLVDETTDKDGRKIIQDYDEPEERPAPAYRPAPKVRPQPRPQPQFQDYEEERHEQRQEFQSFGPAPKPQPIFAPAPRPVLHHQAHTRPVHSFQSSGSPVPPRAAIPGAAPAFSPAPVYEQPRPAPIRLPPPPQQQAYRAPPPQQQAYRPPPQQQAYRPPQHETRGGRSGGILDQLAKDYALPQGGGRPTHDITFSSY